MAPLQPWIVRSGPVASGRGRQQLLHRDGLPVAGPAPIGAPCGGASCETLAALPVAEQHDDSGGKFSPSGGVSMARRGSPTSSWTSSPPLRLQKQCIVGDNHPAECRRGIRGGDSLDRNSDRISAETTHRKTTLTAGDDPTRVFPNRGEGITSASLTIHAQTWR
ncbi:hypothetical protein BO71DRAFT_119546 [Aspergillus ellipticus CBS 707.79]|uniref:Uncharacterized protein n=1 Tax=Aspergillus ellipticus CBS 707.79 TaxID=1448320 RepID=A0A319CUU0_9EURO|nr:hypothetical protein BO71DRAFT_119546 [Aspergillus ellipticus CBS 707.79]